MNAVGSNNELDQWELVEHAKTPRTDRRNKEDLTKS